MDTLWVFMGICAEYSSARIHVGQQIISLLDYQKSNIVIFQ